MRLYIGVDLGTSAVKLLLMDANGGILNTVTKEYVLLHTKVCTTVCYKHIKLLKTSLVKEHINSFTSSIFAFFVL